MTLRRLFREFVVLKHRLRDDYNRDITLAWHIEAMHRQKRLPTLQSLLRRQTEKQTPKQHRAMVQMLSDVYKIPVRKRKKVH